MSIYSAAADGDPEESRYELSNPSGFSGAGTYTFDAPANAVLAKQTTYFVVMEATTTAAYIVRATASNDEDSGAAMGWSIADVTRWSRDDRSSLGRPSYRW